LLFFHNAQCFDSGLYERITAGEFISFYHVQWENPLRSRVTTLKIRKTFLLNFSLQPCVTCTSPVDFWTMFSNHLSYKYSWFSRFISSEEFIDIFYQFYFVVGCDASRVLCICKRQNFSASDGPSASTSVSLNHDYLFPVVREVRKIILFLDDFDIIRYLKDEIKDEILIAFRYLREDKAFDSHCLHSVVVIGIYELLFIHSTSGIPLNISQAIKAPLLS
jgi:hypothetical protein